MTGRHGIEVRDEPRRVRVSLGGGVLAESARAKVLHETGSPPRYYLPLEDVLAELEPSDTRTTCPYKGVASYWHVRVGDELHRDLVWSYPEAEHEGAPVRGLFAFYNERVEISLG